LCGGPTWIENELVPVTTPATAIIISADQYPSGTPRRVRSRFAATTTTATKAKLTAKIRTSSTVKLLAA
jgi:hypothetical protein